MQTLFIPARRPHPARPFMPFLLPQSPDTKVSPVLPHRPWIRRKDGTLISGTLKLQFFYTEEGLLSFVVLNVVKTERLPPDFPIPDYVPPPDLTCSESSPSSVDDQRFAELSLNDQQQQTSTPSPPGFISFEEMDWP